MDIERPHRTTSTPTTTSELFICFTSRLSKSSSMRLSSKSILSPARTTTDKSAQPLSLSTSLSRRLRHNGSLRGGQSPAMFPSKKTRGSSGFAENPEPSSPKVTCIGQVRVKTKKQGKKMKMRACRSKRLSGGSGEASFRRIEHPLEGGSGGGGGVQSQECGLKLNHRNQRWVHLPLTICEALRAFGNEFSCLFPCKSSCFSGGKRGDERESSTNSCAVFRWLVSLQEGEGDGKRRDIELVVGGEEVGVVERSVRSESIMMERESSRRRSIFDDMEFDDLFNNVRNEGEICNDNDGDDEEEGVSRVSICIPPKNALLLMRCRSDPIKMASLSHKLWEAPLPQNNNDDDDDDDNDDNDNDKDDDDDNEEEEEGECEIKEEKLEEKVEIIEDEEEEIGEDCEKIDVWVECEDLPCFIGEEEEKVVEDEEKKPVIENKGEKEEQQCEITEETSHVIMKDETLENGSSIEVVQLEENEQDLSVNLEEQIMEKEVESSMTSNNNHNSNATLEKEESSELCTSSNSLEQSKEGEQEEDPIQLEQEKDSIQVEEEKEQEQEQEQGQGQVQVEARKSMERETKTKPTLPDCLLLMMCEPKVSMEVSKETWVCTTDFLKYLPERHPKKNPNKTDTSDNSTNKKKPPPVQPSTNRFEPVNHLPVQPARSSISFPAGSGSVANLIEQKLVSGSNGGGGAYEPLVLTRCKSAPMRSAAAKIAPSEMACSLWGRENGRKLEPHRPATFGVGAAGVGF